MPVQRQEIRSLTAPGAQARMPAQPDPIGDAMQSLLSQTAQTLESAATVKKQYDDERIDTETRAKLEQYTTGGVKTMGTFNFRKSEEDVLYAVAGMEAQKFAYDETEQDAFFAGTDETQPMATRIRQWSEVKTYGWPPSSQMRYMDGITPTVGREIARRQEEATEANLNTRMGGAIADGSSEDEAIRVSMKEKLDSLITDNPDKKDAIQAYTIPKMAEVHIKNGNVAAAAQIQEYAKSVGREDLAAGAVDSAKRQNQQNIYESNMLDWIRDADNEVSANLLIAQVDAAGLTDPAKNNNAKNLIRSHANTAWENKYWKLINSGASGEVLDAHVGNGISKGAITEEQKARYNAAKIKHNSHQDKVAFFSGELGKPEGPQVDTNLKDAGIHVGVEMGVFEGEAIGNEGVWRFDRLADGHEREGVQVADKFDSLPNDIADPIIRKFGSEDDAVINDGIRELSAFIQYAPDKAEQLVGRAKGMEGARMLRVKVDARDGNVTPIAALKNLQVVKLTDEEVAQYGYSQYKASTVPFSSAALRNLRTKDIDAAIDSDRKAKVLGVLWAKDVVVPELVVDAFGDSYEERLRSGVNAGLTKAENIAQARLGAMKETFDRFQPALWDKTIFIADVPLKVTTETLRILKASLANAFTGKTTPSNSAAMGMFRPVWYEGDFAYADVTNLGEYPLLLNNDGTIYRPKWDIAKPKGSWKLEREREGLNTLLDAKTLDRPMAQYMIDKGIPRFDGDWSEEGQIQAVREMIFRYKQLGENPKTIGTDPRYNAPNGWSAEASALLHANFPVPDKATK